ncbi:MAG: fibronectin type III domain-containing protein, partial [Candidatus Zixiibacteriota bacterium]
MKLKFLTACCVLCVGLSGAALAQVDAEVELPADTVTAVMPAPPGNLLAEDSENDHGHSVRLQWSTSPDDGGGLGIVIGYRIFRAESPDGPYVERGNVPAGATSHVDVGAKEEESPNYMADHVDYYYRVRALTVDNSIYADSEIFGPVQSFGQWFNTGRIPVLIFVVFFLTVTITFIQKAKGGADLFVRRLAGIEAVDEAIGRATEMGRP